VKDGGGACTNKKTGAYLTTSRGKNHRTRLTWEGGSRDFSGVRNLREGLGPVPVKAAGTRRKNTAVTTQIEELGGALGDTDRHPPKFPRRSNRQGMYGF